MKPEGQQLFNQPGGFLLGIGHGDSFLSVINQYPARDGPVLVCTLYYIAIISTISG
jgi:hypothetical protein